MSTSGPYTEVALACREKGQVCRRLIANLQETIKQKVDHMNKNTDKLYMQNSRLLQHVKIYYEQIDEENQHITDERSDGQSQCEYIDQQDTDTDASCLLVQAQVLLGVGWRELPASALRAEQLQ